KQNPHAAFIYGILTDANVELGNYTAAVRMADSMCGIRPDLRSYSRISYMREIYGDFNGAKEAMKMAVNAGIPGFEQTEWCRVYLGKLYETSGSIDTAELIYTAASIARPNYAYAIAGLGRIQRAKKNYTQAIKYFEQANGLVKDYTFGDELIDLYRLTNQKQKADEVSKEVIAKLNEHANTDDKNGDAGHYADKELAYVYLKLNENDLALKHAKAEYDRRPDNIDINEMMAWVYYKRGEFTYALGYLDKALRTGSKNPDLLCRAGLIYCSNNQIEKGSAMIAQAININPFLQEDLLAEAKKYLPANAQLADKK
ncbi:MAG: tetratricopeptide repeat protein, partial [Chitinophagales bacterium]|nr:tetratricopeptide repeat protein [Chitinophagales bacterium]